MNITNMLSTTTLSILTGTRFMNRNRYRHNAAMRTTGIHRLSPIKGIPDSTIVNNTEILIIKALR